MTTAFWQNLLVRAALTGLLFGLTPIATALSGGSFGNATLYTTAAAIALGAAISAIVSALSTIVGDPTSGTFGTKST